jgi:hypothetical protein
MGMKDGRSRPLVIRRLAADTFTFTPEAELEPGEYVLSGSYPASGYDFGVTEAN